MNKSNNYKSYKGKVKSNRVVSNNKPKLHGKRNGVSYWYKNKRIKQARYYDKNGKARKDIDFDDHNNPKMHPVVPHKHYWSWKKGKPDRHKWKPLRRRR